MKGVFAWMGVPLIAGSETIGLLSLGSRDAAVIYTTEQTGSCKRSLTRQQGQLLKATYWRNPIVEQNNLRF
jgi:hypothetical protein